MIISHFELIFKPQSPNSPPSTGPVDNLIQGYFLEITNLSSQTIEYLLRFRAARATVPNRSLAGNTIYILDRPDIDNQFGRLNGSFLATSFTPSTGRIELDPNETALVAVLPSAFGPIPGIDTSPLTSPNFEVRGIVELSVPAIAPPSTGSTFTRPVAQTSSPVPTLLTPQNRTTYFKADGTISDQTQASLPTSTGAALIEIAPDRGGFVIPPLDRFDRFDFDFFDASGFSNADLLAGLLANTDPETAELTELNKAMAEAGIGFAIERRKVKAS